MTVPSPEPGTAPVPRYESLDAWRGVACLLVAVYHATFYLTDLPPAPTGARATVIAILRTLWVGVPAP